MNFTAFFQWVIAVIAVLAFASVAAVIADAFGHRRRLKRMAREDICARNRASHGTISADEGGEGKRRREKGGAA